jgi:hypothetical protein
MGDPMSQRFEEFSAHRAADHLVVEHQLPNEDIVRLVFHFVDRVPELADRLTTGRHDQSRLKCGSFRSISMTRRRPDFKRSKDVEDDQGLVSSGGVIGRRSQRSLYILSEGGALDISKAISWYRVSRAVRAIHAGR